MELYERIKYFCSLKGVTPSGMCVELGISKNVVSNLKQGRVKTLSVKNLSLIANYFGISVSELLGENDVLQEGSPLYENMNSVELVKAICKERGIAISKLERDLDFANGYISRLKKGSFPADRLFKIADYLGVTVDYLLTGENTDHADEPRPLSDDDIKFALFGGDGEITDAMYEEVKNFAAFVKQRERGKDNNK